MKKEIIYRIIRIIFVIVFVMCLSVVRNDVKASYERANEITKQMPNFVVTALDNSIDKSSGLKEEHSVNIKNISNDKQDVSFVLNNVNEDFPYDYMNYTIVKNNKVVKKGIIKENETLYKDNISSQKNNSYKIIFSISQNTINSLGHISTYAQISFN